MLAYKFIFPMDSTAIFQWIFTAVYVLLIVGTLLVVIFENKNPTKTLSWMLVLMFLPAAGLILYYIFGQDTRKKRRKEITYDDFGKDILANLGIDETVNIEIHERKVSDQYANLVNLLKGSDYSYVMYGSDVEIITKGERKFEALLNDIEQAKHHIHMEYFYFKRDETGRKVKELLMKKASEGVEVRFIHENIANITVSPRFYNEMKKAGVQVIPFSKASLPWMRRQLNYRDHRKIAVIDGTIGYMGGMNIGNEYANDWRDTHLRILGQGVNALQTTFLYYFYCSGGKRIIDYTPYFPVYEQYSDNLLQIVPESPGSPWPYLLLTMIQIAGSARDYLYIQTPYYLPSDSLLHALQAAALRGVDIRIMLSHKSDFFFMDPAIHSYYEESLSAGIRIYERHDRFIHAKTLVSDDYLSVIGSANMDFRSLELNFEINCYMYDKKIAMKNKAIFEEEMKLCQEVRLETWIKRAWWKKASESLIRPFS
jgi:cardiolipin synthase